MEFFSGSAGNVPAFLISSFASLRLCGKPSSYDEAALRTRAFTSRAPAW
jgi:hypothetical protein